LGTTNFAVLDQYIAITWKGFVTTYRAAFIAMNLLLLLNAQELKKW